MRLDVDAMRRHQVDDVLVALAFAAGVSHGRPASPKMAMMSSANFAGWVLRSLRGTQVPRGFNRPARKSPAHIAHALRFGRPSPRLDTLFRDLHLAGRRLQWLGSGD